MEALAGWQQACKAKPSWKVISVLRAWTSWHSPVVPHPPCKRTDGGSTPAGPSHAQAQWLAWITWGVEASLARPKRDFHSLYKSVAEHQSCKLKVLGSIPSEGLLACLQYAGCSQSAPWQQQGFPTSSLVGAGKSLKREFSLNA